MSRHRHPGPASGQLDLLGPAAEGWWEWRNGGCVVWVIADDRDQAAEKAEAVLRDLGVTPGGPPGLHERFQRMRRFALGGRRR